MRHFRHWPLSPFILGVYPVIYVFSVNLGSLGAAVIVKPLLIAFLAASFLYLLCSAATRNWHKGAIIADFMLFSSYLVTSLIDTACPWIYGSPLSKFIALAIIAAILISALLLGRFLSGLADSRRDLTVANFVSLMLLFIPMTQIALFQMTSARQSLRPANLLEHPESVRVRPDVYYIILDGYASAQVLSHDLGYDNSRFINFLRQKGFFVARKSRSNYAYTYLSLASSMNMNYINDLDEAPDQQEECIRRIQESSVLRLFRTKGYKVIHFAPDWLVTSRNPYSETTFNPRTVNEFENLVLKRFLLRPFINQGIMNAYKIRTIYTLHSLEAIAEDPRSTFVFAHILCPHPPFVFDRQGETPELQPYIHRPPGSRDWYPKERYTDQVDYLNHLVEKTVEKILKKSKTPPIIILQGDHGAACDGTSDNPSTLMVRERMGILNAYYVPIELRKELYPSITPVNTFRILGNYLFHARFKLLPDASYYSGPIDAIPYHFVDARKWLPDEKKPDRN